MNMEDALLQAIEDNPYDWTLWLILADWLDEHNEPERAELLRLQYILGQEATPPHRSRQEERLRELIAEGVRPCLPVRTNSIGMRLALVPAGTLLMGSPPSEAERPDGEPQHEVEITQAFYAGIYAVTQEQYQRVLGVNPSWFSSTGRGRSKVKGMDTGQFPVESVSWDETVEFCRRLSELPEEKGDEHLYRLPTEAEWEYICRGGPFFKTSSLPFYFGNSLSSMQANFNGNYPWGGAAKGPFLGRTTQVGSYPPNALGLYDLHGNVWEWTSTLEGSSRLFRGGSWFNSAEYCTASFRYRDEPDFRDGYLGFRVLAVPSGAK